MSSGKKIGLILGVLCVAVGGGYYFKLWPFASREPRQAIEIENGKSVANNEPEPMKNTGPVSPITGVACEHWNRRPVAVMQPADVQTRPPAGFSQADMVFEMPTPASNVMVTRLMGVYLCNTPEDIGSIRSTRHDFIAMAGGLNAVFVGWGGSAFALHKLNEGVIDNIDCNGQGGKKAPECCYRKPLGQDGLNRVEDTGYVKGEKIFSCAKDFGYMDTPNTFAGYLHQEDASSESRPNGGHLRVGYPTSAEAEYDYDPTTNSYLRPWGGLPDTDRNTKERVAPKNVVVMTAENEQIMNQIDYSNRPQDPWSGLEDWEKTGPKNISGRYNNLQIGDPWFDTLDKGDAKFYLNGKEYVGTWKKDKSSLASKLTFFDQSGKEILFVPGQIWVDVVVPGMAVEWTPQT